MTFERAVEILNLNAVMCEANDFVAACEKATTALEKQIPETVIYEGDGYDDEGNMIYDTAYCPECNHSFEVDYDEHCKYCPDCGQALDWKNEK